MSTQSEDRVNDNMRTKRHQWLTRKGLRWTVAHHANRLPGQCWAELVEWALGWHRDDPGTWWNNLVRRAPIRRQTSCVDDMARTGACYCGKLMTSECRAAQTRRVLDLIDAEERLSPRRAPEPRRRPLGGRSRQPDATP